MDIFLCKEEDDDDDGEEEEEEEEEELKKKEKKEKRNGNKERKKKKKERKEENRKEGRIARNRAPSFLKTGGRGDLLLMPTHGAVRGLSELCFICFVIAFCLLHIILSVPLSCPGSFICMCFTGILVHLEITDATSKNVNQSISFYFAKLPALK